MAHIKNYKEFLIEQRRINLDLGKAKERGEIAADVFNQNLDTLSLHYPISVKVNI